MASKTFNKSDTNQVDVLRSGTGTSDSCNDFNVKKNGETMTRRDHNNDDDDDDTTETDPRHNGTRGNHGQRQYDDIRGADGGDDDDDINHDHLPLNSYRDGDEDCEGDIRSSTTPPTSRGQDLREELGENHHPDYGRCCQWKRWVVLLVLLSTIGFVVIDSAVGGSGVTKGTLLSILDWVEHHPIRGAVLVSFVYAIATVLFVPGSILTLGAGYALGHAISGPTGVIVAAVAVFIGASIGSVCSFLLGRYLFRDCVMNLTSNYPIFHAVDGALQHNGLKIMVLLRLSPLIPYNALDYMSGITAISLRDYAVALVALLPGSFMLSFIGASASSLADSTSAASGSEASIAVKILTIVSGLVFGGGGILAVSYYSNNELNRVSFE